MCLGIPGEVIELYARDGMRFGRVRFAGLVREVCMAYEPDAEVGDFVLVHVGFAISRIDAEQAARTWEVLAELAETDAASEPSSDARSGDNGSAKGGQP